MLCVAGQETGPLYKHNIGPKQLHYSEAKEQGREQCRLTLSRECQAVQQQYGRSGQCGRKKEGLQLLQTIKEVVATPVLLWT